MLRPKFVYPLAFAKATEASICRIESGYGNMLRRSLSVAQGFPWEVISGSLEYDGLGVNCLSTEVTKARLRLFQAMMTSRFDTENGMAMAMARLAQRWCGASTPVTSKPTEGEVPPACCAGVVCANETNNNEMFST